MRTRQMAHILDENGVIDIKMINTPDRETIYHFMHKDQTVVLRSRDTKGYFMALGRQFSLFYT